MKWPTRCSHDCKGQKFSSFLFGFILVHKSHPGATRKYTLGVGFLLKGKKGKTLQLCADKKK